MSQYTVIPLESIKLNDGYWKSGPAATDDRIIELG